MQEKVEFIKSGLATWNAGDMQALRELWHPDATLRPPEGWPERGPFKGREAVFRQFEVLREAWENAEVLVRTRLSGTATASSPRCIGAAAVTVLSSTWR